MTLSTKKSGYAFLIRLDLMFPMSLWKEFQLLHILNDLSIKNSIELVWYKNDVKIAEKYRYRSICNMFKVWDFDYWYLKWVN